MLPTRRKFLLGGTLSALLPALHVPARAAPREFPWRDYGADPFATSERDAIAALPKALTLLGIPERYHEELEQLVAAHPKGMRRHSELQKGDRLEAMLSKGGVVYRNVLVDFEDIESGIRPYDTYEWDFELGTLVLPLVCFNWSWRRGCVNCSCYTISFDYSATPKVAWDAEHRARVSMHLNAMERELEAALAEPCFSVTDAKGTTKPFHPCETCEVGEYPPPDLAKAVGLPPSAPTSSPSFRLQDGVGRLSLPKAWMPRWMLFCVKTEAYPVSAPSFGGWRALSRFDIVREGEIARTLPRGILGRTLSGGSSY